MKIRALVVALAALAPFATTLPAATLGEMVSTAGLEWMVGKWVSADGQVSFSHTWKLDKHALATTFKMGDRESEGLILVKPGTNQVISGGADNQGGATTGEWTKLNDNPTLISTHTDADGNVRKMAVEYLKTDDTTITVKLHAVGENGQPEPTATREIVFKRQP